MSNTVRWILALVLFLSGIFIALFALLFLGFFTWGCSGATGAAAHVLLYVAAGVSFLAPFVPAVMLVRKTAGKFVWIAVAVSILLTVGLNGLYLFYTLNICK